MNKAILTREKKRIKRTYSFICVFYIFKGCNVLFKYYNLTFNKIHTLQTFLYI